MSRINLAFVILICILLLPFIANAKECNQNNIKVESIILEDTRGNIEEVSAPNSDDGKIHLDLKMNVVGDFAEYKIILKNTSDEEYYFDEKSLNLDTNYVDYEVQYEDGSTLIKSGEDKIITLKVVYKNKVASSNLVNGLYSDNQVLKVYLSDKSIIDDLIENPVTGRNIIFFVIIGLIIGFILINKKYRKSSFLLLVFLIIPFTVKALCRHTLEIETNLVIDGKEAIFLPGKEVNVKMKHLAGDDTSSVTDEYTFRNETITSIKYSDVEPSELNKEEKNIVSTSDSSYPIYMWYEDGTIYWWSEDKTPALNEDASYMFCVIQRLTDISGVEQFDLFNVKNMEAFFVFDSDLANITPLSNWNVSNVTDMSYIFGFDSSLLSLDGLSNWNVSKVINLKGAFSACENLETILELENWDTSNLEDMSFTFNYNLSLKDISPIKNWNVSKVKTMRQLFSATISLKSADLSNWKTDSLQDIVNLFGMWNSDGTYRNDSQLQEINLTGFNTSNVTNMSLTFVNNPKLNRIIGIKNLDTSNVTDMSYMFSNCTSLTNLDIGKWNTSNVTDMSYMFNNTSLDELDISSFDTRSVTNFKRIFNYSTKLKHIYVGENWNTDSNTDETKYVFPTTCELPNFSSSNPNYRDLSYAHTGEGGYLTLKTD